MSNSEVIESKKLEVSSAIIIAALTGLLTLGGVMSTSLLGWISSTQSAKLTEQAAKLSAQQACVARLDTQEQNLRAKADTFLTALGNFVSLTARVEDNEEILSTRLDEVLKSGYAFSAYAPETVSNLTKTMVIRLKNTIIEKDVKKIAEYEKAFNETYMQWSDQYQVSLKEIDSFRKNCTL